MLIITLKQLLASMVPSKQIMSDKYSHEILLVTNYVNTDVIKICNLICHHFLQRIREKYKGKIFPLPLTKEIVTKHCHL